MNSGQDPAYLEPLRQLLESADPPVAAWEMLDWLDDNGWAVVTIEDLEKMSVAWALQTLRGGR